ncbi:STAS domain-containing protein [Fictibacillus terranigra]|uniref:Anti-sigma factor antagonist n=1 Tax=Fictibacillus terranigra TaxID=3058424 RepID=A0ABT8EDA2_9BACL|nr:STAS domain-containing protein [Fictibacillus sp. CENA-BCM004]MDN4075911.1 STAS domain-containing protein [Fictibacillus sp. CENA-BCM004]
MSMSMGNVMDLNITHEKLNGTHYLELVGEVQSYTAPKLKAILFPLSEQTKQKIIIDVEKIDFIDSIGLGVFAGAFKLTKRSNSTLILKGMKNHVRRLFEVTGLI